MNAHYIYFLNMKIFTGENLLNLLNCNNDLDPNANIHTIKFSKILIDVGSLLIYVILQIYIMYLI